VKAITEPLVSKHKQVTPTGSTAAKDPVVETAGWATYKKKVPIEAKAADTSGTLRTLEGPARYQKGDMIARGAKGEKWPIRADVFAKTYKKIGPAHGAKTAQPMPFTRFRLPSPRVAPAKKVVKETTKSPAFGVMSPRAAGHIGSKSKLRLLRGGSKVAFRIRGRWADEVTEPTKEMFEWAKTPEGRRALVATGGVALLSAAGVGFLDQMQNDSLHQRDRYPE